MTHTATGVSGVDLYAEDGEGISRWVNGVGAEDQKVDKTLAQGSPWFPVYIVFSFIMGLIKWKLVLKKVIF